MPVAYGQVSPSGEQACPAGTWPIADGHEPASGAVAGHEGAGATCHPPESHVAIVSQPICTASPYSHARPSGEQAAPCAGAEGGQDERPASIEGPSVPPAPSAGANASAVSVASAASFALVASSPLVASFALVASSPLAASPPALASFPGAPVSPAEPASWPASAPPAALVSP